MVEGSGNYGFGELLLQFVGPPGINRYHLMLDDGNGANWCMDYTHFVDLMDNTRPGSCLGTPPSTALATTADASQQSGGNATVTIEFVSPYDLRESDMALVPVSGAGAGSIITGSLIGGPLVWSLRLAGVAPLDRYEVAVNGGVDSCGTTFAGSASTPLGRRTRSTSKSRIRPS